MSLCVFFLGGDSCIGKLLLLKTPRGNWHFLASYFNSFPRLYQPSFSTLFLNRLATKNFATAERVNIQAGSHTNKDVKPRLDAGTWVKLVHFIQVCNLSEKSPKMSPYRPHITGLG